MSDLTVLRRAARPLGLAVLALCAMAPSSPPPPFFPVAVWYGGGTVRAPMLAPIDAVSEQAWREDIRTIKALGFNAVRTWVEWSAGEPREGEYHFENLQLVLKLAEEAGLKVLVQVYVDSAPEWVGRKYPDGRFVAQGGDVISPQAAPGFCFDHPGVRRAVLAFFEETARRASTSRAFYAYDLWSEPAVMNWAQPSYLPGAQFCYCPHSVARFREWLRAKYSSLERLNRAWYRTFASWDQVEPPRFGTILTYADFVDWRVYTGDKLAADLAARAAAVRGIDPDHPVTSHAPNPSPVFRTLADAMDASDDYLMTPAVDYFGTSFYPKLTSPERDFPLERRALVFDAVRAVTGDRGFYVGEVQAGYGVHGVIAGNPITASDLELYAWSAVARGARAISFYAYYPMSTGYESGGYGLINLDGTLTDRSRRAGALAGIIDREAAALLSARPTQPEVAIVFNPLVPLLGGEQAYGDRRAMHRAVAGYHRLFFERNIPVALPSARGLTAAALKPFKLVIVPCPLLMTRDIADALAAYARDGGHLLVEARAGWQDEAGRAEPVIPGFGWHGLFGVREAEVRPVKQIGVTWNGRSFTGIGFAERFEALAPDARVAARFEDGTPAAYERTAGAGRVMILGTFAGERNALEPMPMNPLGDALAEWAGLVRPPLASSAFVELRRMSGPGVEWVFLLNHGAAAADVDYTFEAGKPVTGAREVVAGAVVPGDATRVRITTTIPAESARVYRVALR